MLGCSNFAISKNQSAHKESIFALDCFKRMLLKQKSKTQKMTVISLPDTMHKEHVLLHFRYVKIITQDC